jgi:predicted O-linked N-acetylglucosamine transferase (SPINDLY family)
MTRAPDPIVVRAVELLKAGRAGEAVTEITRALHRDANNANLHQLIGQAYLMTGKPEQAIYHFERALPHYPNAPALLNNYANALVHVRRFGEAVQMWERSLRLKPDYAAAYLGLCMAHAQARNYSVAIASGLRAVELAPQTGEAHQNAALSLLESGRPHDAMRVLIAGVAKCPRSTSLHSTMLIAQNYVPSDRAETLAMHTRYGTMYRAQEGLAPARTDPTPDRPLRVGVLSSDFHNHSVSYFFEPLLSQRDRSRWSVRLYSVDAHPPDAMRAHLTRNADSFIDLVRQNFTAIDQRIRRDAIDILIELNGHSANNRLPALVGKPAPIIVSAIGYPNTTGVPAIDYRVVDSLTDPPGAEAFATERLLRLDPCFLCYRPPESAPDVAPLPCLAAPGAPITFGSFNSPQKISNDAVRLWRRVLMAVPGSRLLLKGLGFGDPTVVQWMRERFEAEGVDGSRIEALSVAPDTRAHLELYARMDIALDVTPYHGTTTTCEALWMGVPVVSLIGAPHASRVGLSLLTNVGHAEWTAQSPEEFVSIAKQLAGDRGALASIRRTLREQVRSSPLCDGEAYAHRFYAALRGCWHEWCAEQRPPESEAP